MLVYGEDIEDLEEESIFRVTENTKTFVVGFFGFYPYNSEKRFKVLLKDLGIEEVSDNGSFPMELFELDGKYGLEAHDQSGGGTFDVTIILPKTFNSVEAALEWFHKSVKDCNLFSIGEISSIEVIDADKLMNYISEETSENIKRENLTKEINEELEDLKTDLLDHYRNDKYALEFIKDKLKKLSITSK